MLTTTGHDDERRCEKNQPIAQRGQRAIVKADVPPNVFIAAIIGSEKKTGPSSSTTSPETSRTFRLFPSGWAPCVRLFPASLFSTRQLLLFLFLRNGLARHWHRFVHRRQSGRVQCCTRGNQDRIHGPAVTRAGVDCNAGGVHP